MSEQVICDHANVCRKPDICPHSRPHTCGTVYYQTMGDIRSSVCENGCSEVKFKNRCIPVKTKQFPKTLVLALYGVLGVCVILINFIYGRKK